MEPSEHRAPEERPADIEQRLSFEENESLRHYAERAGVSAAEAVATCAAALAEIVKTNPTADFQALPAVDAARLRDRIFALAVVLRATGVPPQEAVLTIKRMVRGAEGSFADSSLIMTTAVTWLIEGYYRS